MNGSTHVLLGTATLLALTVKFSGGMSIIGIPIEMPALGLLTVSVGSYMPDIDLATSKMGSKHKFISKVLTHRGPLTHSLLVPAILAELMFLSSAIPLLSSVIFGFFLGWVCHLLADLCNGKGIPLLWPIYRKRIHIMDIPLTGILNKLYVLVWLGGLVAWLMLS